MDVVARNDAPYEGVNDVHKGDRNSNQFALSVPPAKKFQNTLRYVVTDKKSTVYRVEADVVSDERL